MSLNIVPWSLAGYSFLTNVMSCWSEAWSTEDIANEMARGKDARETDRKCIQGRRTEGERAVPRKYVQASLCGTIRAGPVP